ncbi:tRNA pseudouridine(38-40) synthase TruA [Suttonella ornithocola]|uniref:tRNA pseudouridine synthase A n=1 Tax=Suttonella ornithocola TaxID=279832 RepID=A0A380MZX5_9GAMM|nr:tRNA pseudouridine(38-40) synthase TruA [Suttonella ornithocola]SUO97872.1 tRNA pseudouridine synthase A [Suttonella ornithocola]
MTQRYAVLVEYDGTAYSGWQRQPFLSQTIQTQVEQALSQIANQTIEIVCAGRTDAGVHALGQIIHFDTSTKRDNYAWLAGSNRYLPHDIRLKSILPVRSDFHARYDAQMRQYRYLILNSRQPSSIWYQKCHWHPHPLSVENMQQAAIALYGENDFSAFRAAECQAKSPNRYIKEIIINRQGEWISIDVIGNAFLHHMVRNIVGSLLMVGDNRCAISWLAEILHKKDRRQAGPTAPAYGLYFYRVFYPDCDNIPYPNEGQFPL